jgi:hypothetical protein
VFNKEYYSCEDIERAIEVIDEISEKFRIWKNDFENSWIWDTWFSE